jgi:hypothetical protein
MATRQRHVRAQAERRRFATAVVKRRAATAPAVGAACDDVEGVPQQRCRTSHQSKVPAKLMFRVGVASAAAPGAVNERLFCTPIAGFWSIEDLRFRPPTLFPNGGKTRQKNVFRFFSGGSVGTTRQANSRSIGVAIQRSIGRHPRFVSGMLNRVGQRRERPIPQARAFLRRDAACDNYEAVCCDSRSPKRRRVKICSRLSRSPAE